GRQPSTRRPPLVEEDDLVPTTVQRSGGHQTGEPRSDDADPHQAAVWSLATLARKSSTTLLKVVACSIIKPCAAPEMITSSAPGMRSASSSLSPRGVSTSWLPTTTSVGTWIWTSWLTSSSGASRIALTWDENAWAGGFMARGPNHPSAGQSRRTDR